MDRMDRVEGERFPAKNVFHYSLRNRKREEISLANTISVTARGEDGKLFGYLRILTDHAYMHYILDVMVDPECRGLGVGSQLTSIALEECKKKGFIKIFLTAIPGKEDFYGRFGFKPTMSPVMTVRGEDYPEYQS